MRIDGPRDVGKSRKKAGSVKSAGSGAKFVIGGAPEASGLTGSGPASISNIGALLAVQEVDGADNAASRAAGRAIRRGNDMLDILDQLKVGFLAGRVSPGGLNQLRHLVADQAQLKNREGLGSVIQAIELRAEVELAKLSQKKS